MTMRGDLVTVVGIGLDIVAVDRLAAAIARRRDRFLARVFAEPELAGSPVAA